MSLKKILQTKEMPNLRKIMYRLMIGLKCMKITSVLIKFKNN